MANSKAVSTDERPYSKLVSELATVAELNAETDGNDFAFSVAAKAVDEIMSADSIDAVFAANDSGPADLTLYLNTPVNVTGVRYFKSQEKFKANGLGAYVVIDALTLDGEVVMLSTGAPNVVASMRKLQTLGAFSEDKPLRMKITGTDTANGTLYKVAKA